MPQNILTVLFGSKHERDLKEILPILHKINEHELWAMELPDEAFPQKTAEFKKDLRKEKPLKIFCRKHLRLPGKHPAVLWENGTMMCSFLVQLSSIREE